MTSFSKNNLYSLNYLKMPYQSYTSIRQHLDYYDYTSAHLRLLGFDVVAFTDQIYRLKGRKKRWFSR